MRKDHVGRRGSVEKFLELERRCIDKPHIKDDTIIKIGSGVSFRVCC